MKPVLMFIMQSCPYCKQALSWMEELKKENPKYAAVEVEIVDEKLNSALAGRYDYYYVPAYYVDGVKIHEGVATKDIVRNMFETACQ